ncbi:MAG: c-type cytochrome [Planctomycetales bacterium]
MLNLAATPSQNFNGQNLSWQSLTAAESQFPLATPATRSSHYFAFDLQSAQRHEVALWITGQSRAKLWHNGRLIYQPPPVAAPPAPIFVDIQPGSNTLLLRIQNTSPDPLGITFRAPSDVIPTLPEKIDAGDLIARLKAASSGQGSNSIPEAFLKEDWNQTRTKEQAAEGRKLFGSLGCAKCHPITPDQQGSGAPSLAEAKKRFNIPHIVESVLLPNKQVAEPFRATLIVTTAGKPINGLVVQDTPDSVELLLPDTTRITLKKSEIEERKLLETSPMPQGLVKTPAELQALLAYLLSDVPLPP